MGKLKLLRGYVDARIASIEARLAAIQAETENVAFVRRDGDGRAIEGWIKTSSGTVSIGDVRRYANDEVVTVVDIDTLDAPMTVTVILRKEPGKIMCLPESVAKWPLVTIDGEDLRDLRDELGKFVGEDGKSAGALEMLLRLTAELREWRAKNPPDRRRVPRTAFELAAAVDGPPREVADALVLMAFEDALRRLYTLMDEECAAAMVRREDAGPTSEHQDKTLYDQADAEARTWIAAKFLMLKTLWHAPPPAHVPASGVCWEADSETMLTRSCTPQPAADALIAKFEEKGLQAAHDTSVAWNVSHALVERGQSRANAAGDVVRLSAGSMGEPKTFVVHRVLGELLLMDGVPVLEEFTADVIVRRWPIRLAGNVVDADALSPVDQQALAKAPRRSAAVAAQQCRTNDDGDVIRVEDPFKDGWTLRGIVGKAPPSTWSTEAVLKNWPIVLADAVQRIKRVPSDTKLFLGATTPENASERVVESQEGQEVPPKRAAITAPTTRGTLAEAEDKIGRYADLVLGPVVQRFRWVPPGKFMMGSPLSEKGRFDDEGPLHEVTITQGYWMGDTPVTQALYEAVMKTNPSRFRGAELPVEQISWDDDDPFIARINEIVPGLNARRPWEAEWEKACRAGTITATWAGDLDLSPDETRASILDPIAWYYGNSGCKTHPVRSKAPNALGLYDMIGLVWEPCGDVYGPYDPAAAALVDPRGPEAKMGSNRVIRGASWGSNARLGRAAQRRACVPQDRNENLGLRLARGHQV